MARLYVDLALLLKNLRETLIACLEKNFASIILSEFQFLGIERALLALVYFWVVFPAVLSELILLFVAVCTHRKQLPILYVVILQ